MMEETIVPYETTDEIVSLLQDGNELLLQLNITALFVVGVTAGVAVCFVLYKFLRKFF